MNMQRKTMDAGRTGFWIRVGRELNVRVVNGTMCKLPSVKREAIHIPILSLHFIRQTFAARMYRSGKFRLTAADAVSSGSHFGLYGLKASSSVPGWVSNTRSLRSKAQREHQGMSPSIYLNPPFSRLIGLPDGSAYDTLRVFQKRRNAKPTP